MNGANMNLEIIDHGIQGYHSGITYEGKDLTNSAATYRSGHTGHTITSSHYIRPNITTNVTSSSGDSARNSNDHEGGAQYSGNTLGIGGNMGTMGSSSISGNMGSSSIGGGRTIGGAMGGTIGTMGGSITEGTPGVKKYSYYQKRYEEK